jgi:hypothetical protein
MAGDRDDRKIDVKSHENRVVASVRGEAMERDVEVFFEVELKADDLDRGCVPRGLITLASRSVFGRRGCVCYQR